jgi:recombination protein RecA
VERKITRTRSQVRDTVGQIEEPEVKTDGGKYEGRLFLPTGSTLLNLAFSDRVDKGMAVGKIANVIGDQSTGKSFLAKTMLAEATLIPEFDDYRLIYDDVEAADEFDDEALFGPNLVARLEAPGKDGTSSNTVQDLIANVFTAVKKGKPFIYIVDSLDTLASDEELGRIDDLIEAKEKDKEVKGSYQMEKAKWVGQFLRDVKAELKSMNSLLIIISQTRDNIDPKSFVKKKRSGGKALYFYCTYEVWMALEEKQKTKGRVVGVVSKVKVSKNKFTGKLRDVSFPIYYTYGIDDIGSCIDFLIDEDHWKEKGRSIVATEFDVEVSRDKLVRMISEDKSKYKKLQGIVQKVWDDIEIQVTKSVPYSGGRYARKEFSDGD